MEYTESPSILLSRAKKEAPKLCHVCWTYVCLSLLVSSEAGSSPVHLGHYHTEVGAQVDQGEGGEEKTIRHLPGGGGGGGEGEESRVEGLIYITL